MKSLSLNNSETMSPALVGHRAILESLSGNLENNFTNAMMPGKIEPRNSITRTQHASRSLLPETLKNQLFVSAWSLKNVPLIFWCRPRIKELSARSTKIVIPLNRRTKNHLNSMYFGVLAVGADCAGGLTAMKIIKESGKNVSFAFKDFQANFIKRADSDTVFECLDGEGL